MPAASQGTDALLVASARRRSRVTLHSQYDAAMVRLTPTVRTWMLTCAVAVLLVAVVGMAGGFEPRDTRAISVEPGESVSVTRWDLSVDRCEVEADEDGGGRLRVFLRATNRWTETMTGFAGAIGVVLPDGERFGAGEQLMSTVNLDSGGGFDPGFAASARLSADFEQPVWHSPDALRVSLHREVNSDGYLLSGRWGPGGAVAVVHLTCTVVEDEQ